MNRPYSFKRDLGAVARVAPIARVVSAPFSFFANRNQPAPLPPIAVPVNSLAVVLNANFDTWKVQDVGDPLFGLGRWGIDISRVNSLIRDRSLNAQQAAAVAMMKAYILQDPANLMLGGRFCELFVIDRDRNPLERFIAPNGIRRFHASLTDARDRFHAQATQLNQLYLRSYDIARDALDNPRDFPDKLKFPAGEIYKTIRQGYVGDCSFMSSVIGFVKRGNFPTFEEGRNPRIKWVGNVPPGVRIYEVSLFEPNGRPLPNPVRVEEPTLAERALYGGTTDGSRWLSILEKAYVQQWDSGRPQVDVLVEPNFTYDVAANGERMDVALGRVTGRPAVERRNLLPFLSAWPAPLLRSRLDNVNRPGGGVVIAGSNDTADMPAEFRTFPSRHAFAVVGWNNGLSEVFLRNPWNLRGQANGEEFRLRFDQFRRLFRTIAFQR